jgi:hypothetical protein
MQYQALAAWEADGFKLKTGFVRRLLLLAMRYGGDTAGRLPVPLLKAAWAAGLQGTAGLRAGRGGEMLRLSFLYG